MSCIYSGASYTGIASVIKDKGQESIYQSNVTQEETALRFTWQEIEAIRFSINQSIKYFENKNIFWYKRAILLANK